MIKPKINWQTPFRIKKAYQIIQFSINYLKQAIALAIKEFSSIVLK